MFSINQKVVCICDDWDARALARIPNLPVKGAVYHVRAIDNDGYAPGITLRELVNPILSWGNVTAREPAFRNIRFRPVISRSTKAEVAKLKKLLIPSDRKIKERV